MEWNDSQIRQAILKDRETLSGLKADPLYMKVNRWPRAIPYYSTEWEQTLSRLNVQAPLFLHGNYLGGIGLAKIYQRSIKLAREIQELYG